MSVERLPLSQLDPTTVTALQAVLTSRLEATFPQLDFRRGVFHDRIVYLSAMLAADEQTYIDRIQRSLSLADIAADPTLADDDLVDKVLSNFRVTRIQGSAAAGLLTIVVSARAPLTIPAGTVFTVGDVAVATDTVTAVRISSAQVSAPTDRVLQLQPDGNYAFSIAATASEVGFSGMLKRGAAAIPDLPPQNFVKAYVPSDWAGGANTETNAALVTRFQTGIAAPVFSNRANVLALVQSNPTFAKLVGLSIIGAGDPELARSRHSLFPIALPGYCDVYARTARLPLRTSVTKTATLIRSTAQGTIWQFAVGRDEAPGFYEVTQILPFGADPTLTGYGILTDVRDFDLSGVTNPPDLVHPLEAVYSRYQTATITFLDTAKPLGNLTVGISTATYTAVLRAQPNLQELQTTIGSRGTTWPGGDVLVKGAIPCRLRVNFTLFVPPSVAPPDSGAIALRLADAVNAEAFPGKLYASTLIESIADLIPPGAAVGAIDLFGQIRRPDGTIAPIRDPAVLSIPDDPARLVTARTTTFVLDPDDVTITIANRIMPEV